MPDRGLLAERVELDALAYTTALDECGAPPQRRTAAMIESTAITHEFRVSQHKRMMESFSAPMTFDHLTMLADEYAASARKLRIKARAGSERHRGWRLAALNSARAFYTLARRAAK